MSIAERTGIRPSVWVVCAGVVVAAAWAVTLVAGDDRPRLFQRAAADEREEARPPERARRARERATPAPAVLSGDGYRRHDWRAESELSRRIALGLPQPSFWRDPPANELERDPQLAAMFRSFHALRDPDADAPPLPFEPTAHRAELVEAEGDLAASPQSCDVRVLPVDSYRFNCLVRVSCDGTSLYPHPGQNAGYVPCDVEDGRPVRALDSLFSDRDGDPLVDLDLARGTVTVEERTPDGQRRYRATLRITS